MRRGSHSVEVKVGLLVLAAIALLFYMSLRVSRLERIRGDIYYAIFDSVSGLVEGAPVEVAGVPVGRVEEIALAEAKARVKMIIGGVTLREDAEAVLRTRGALGDKFVQIHPGSSAARPLPPGGTIRNTRAAPDLDQLFASLQRTAEGLAGMGEALQELVGDKELREAVRQLVFNLRDSSQEFKGLLTENRERLNSMVANLEGFSRELGPLLQKASKALDSLDGALASFRKMGKDLEEGKGTLGKLVTDESLYREIEETISEFKELAQRVNRGEGTLGKLVTDEGLYRQAERTLKKVEKAAEGMEEQAPITVIGTAAGLVF